MNNSISNLLESIPSMIYSNIKRATNNLSVTESNREEFLKLIEVMQRDKRTNVRKLAESILKGMEKHRKEVQRVKNLYDFDRNFGNYDYIAGVDEVGRGPLAGPIVAAAVILDLKNNDLSELILGLNDSKKLSSKVRKELSVLIREKALSFSIVEIDNNKIDELGIAYCNNKAFKDCSNLLKFQPDLVLSDGYSIKDFNLKNEHVIKGDTKSASIACASIIAKVYRDELMEKYSKIYPQYGFENNVGYGSQQHIDAIKTYGICPLHRKSFLRGILAD